MQLPTFRWTPLLGVIITLTLVAAGLRLWNFSNTLMFQGDQGRDALIVSHIFTKGDPVFIGPVTSVGNMYLGPLYYYFMLPFLFLSYPSPLGPAYAVAFLGILCVPLTYYLGRELVGKRAALIAAFLTTFSVSAVTYSRFSWNPNPAPIVCLVMLWATHRAWKKSSWYWVVVAICFSILLQLHYIAALSILGAGVIWLMQIVEILRLPTKNRTKAALKLLMATGVSVLVVIMSLIPLALFDLKHDGLIHKAFLGLFTEERILDKSPRLSLPVKVASVVKDSLGRGKQIVFEHMIGRFDRINTWLFVGSIAFFFWQLKAATTRQRAGLLVIASYLVTGIVGTAVYQHSLFVHYFAYLFPVVFIFLGSVLAGLSRWRNPVGSAIALASIGIFLVLNIPKLPLDSQAWTINDVSRTSQAVYEHLLPNEQYSLVLLSPSKDLYAQNYRYFLSTTDRPPLAPEQAFTAQTLVVINEENIKNVAELPIYEIITFPHKNDPEVYTIPNGPEILIFRAPEL